MIAKCSVIQHISDFSSRVSLACNSQTVSVPQQLFFSHTAFKTVAATFPPCRLLDTPDFQSGKTSFLVRAFKFSFVEIQFSMFVSTFPRRYWESCTQSTDFCHYNIIFAISRENLNKCYTFLRYPLLALACPISACCYSLLFFFCLQKSHWSDYQ